MKAYILYNKYEGWKVVSDGRNVDARYPIFDSKDISSKGLTACQKYCKMAEIDVIRICR